ncbi:hypothetical protein [Pseudomonas promysalinigenes]|uniref:hypothetical protein n=1 Tax=Pseudomonas promysalinigenes TaxID=485898 RepID=UPI003FA04D89
MNINQQPQHPDLGAIHLWKISAGHEGERHTLLRWRLNPVGESQHLFKTLNWY